MRERTAEPKHTFSIYLPASLYQKVANKAGKGNISTFIRGVLEKELNNDEEQLKRQLIEGYQTQAKNKKLQEELNSLEKVQFEDE